MLAARSRRCAAGGAVGDSHDVELEELTVEAHGGGGTPATTRGVQADVVKDWQLRTRAQSVSPTSRVKPAPPLIRIVFM